MRLSRARTAGLAITAFLSPAGCLEHQARPDAVDAPAAERPFSFDECVQGAWPAMKGECPDAPATAVALETPSEGGPALHWATSLGCIRLTYEPSLAADVALIKEAVAAWADLGCESLCFGPPVEADGPPAPDCHAHRVHFRLEASEMRDPPPVVTELTYDRTNGVLRNAVVTLHTGPSARRLAGAVGRALGLTWRGDVESILDGRSDHEAPTESDRSNACTLYGAPPYCDD